MKNIFSRLQKTFFVFSLLLFFNQGFFVFAQDAVKFYETGLAFQDEENYFEAIDFYKDALEKNPSYGQAWFNLAECYYHIGDFDLALEYAENAEKYFRDSTEVKNLKGMTLISLGRLDEAQKIFDSILKLYPNDITARFGQAQLELFKGSLTAAEKKYQDALQREQYNKTALLSLALISSDMGKDDIAQVYVKKALEYHSGHPQVHYLAAYLAAKRGDLKEAERRARSAVQLRPDYDSAYELLADILYSQERYNEAIDICDFRISRNRNAGDAWYLKGMSLLYLEKIEEAIDVFSQGLALTPTDEVMRSVFERLIIENTEIENVNRSDWASYHIKKALEYKRNFDSSGERYEYQQALKVDPLNIEARQAFAELLNREGFNELYLEQLKFIEHNEETVYSPQTDENAPKVKKTQRQIKNSDAMESLEALLQNNLAHKWEVDPFYLDKARWNIGIYYKKTSVNLLHPDSDLITALALKEMFSGIPSTSVSVKQNAVTGYGKAFSLARYSNCDYFTIVDMDETDRSFTLNAEIYSGRTGTLIEKIKIYRTGNDKYTSALRRFRQSLLSILPVRGKVIAYTGGTILLDLGRSDGISTESSFEVVKQGKLYTADKGTGIAYPQDAVLGTLKLSIVDEEISEGKFIKKGFYDMLNIGDDVVLVANKDEGSENGSVTNDTRPQADSSGQPATKRARLFKRNSDKEKVSTAGSKMPSETTLINLIRSIE